MVRALQQVCEPVRRRCELGADQLLRKLVDQNLRGRRVAPGLAPADNAVAGLQTYERCSAPP